MGAAGIRRAGGKPFPRADDRAYLLVPAGAHGPGFLMLQNFRVIMKYNPAEAYALAIGHLADRLRGGEPFVQAWPRARARAVARRAARTAAAARAAAASTSASRTAGSARKTRAAVRDFQARDRAHVPDGFASGGDPGAAARPLTLDLRDFTGHSGNHRPIFKLTFLSR